MKLYLSASTEYTISHKQFFIGIINFLDSLGIENANPYFSSLIYEKSKQPLPEDLYTTALKSVSNSDLLLVDITEPSVSLGILIEFARANNIPTLCICNENAKEAIPRILTQRKSKSHLFTIIVFNEKNLKKLLDKYFISFKKNKVKFNVFITPEIDSYMRWAAKKKKLQSKSDYFRNLIEKQMKNDPEYN